MQPIRATIIGAGISGLIASKELSSLGSEVYVIEEHKEIGLPTHCGGIVASNFWQKLGITKREKIILNEYSGISFTNGKSIFTLRAKKPFLVAISRVLLDRYVGDLAEKKGARLLTGEKAKRILLQKRGVSVLTSSGKSFNSDVAFVADGIFGSLSNKMFPKKGRNLLFASQAIFRHFLDPSAPLVILRKDISRDFFAYIAPLNNEVARVGVASAKPIANLALKKIAKAYNLKQVEPSVRWSIWIGGPASRVAFYNKIFLLGDAAGFTKATTGGGIVFGSVLSRLLSKLVVSDNGMERKRATEGIEYLRKKLRFMYFTRKLLNFFGSSLYYPLMEKVASFRGVENIVETLDYDFQFDASFHNLATLLALILSGEGRDYLSARHRLRLELASFLDSDNEKEGLF